MKRCTKCGELKNESEFNWRHTGTVKQSVCRDCQHVQGRSHYERNADTVKAKSAEVKKRAVEEAQRYIYEVLSNSVCANCGEYDFAVLTFHHIKGKKMDISTMAAQGYSIKAIQEEISKCIVLCFNCHARVENERRSGGRFRRFWPPWE